MMYRFTFKIELKSNYHIGAGYGKGFGLDSALLTEADSDAPVIRGSTLAGLLRDAARRLLDLPPLKEHPKDQIIERIFGSEKQIKRWAISSAHPKNLEEKKMLQRVRIDPITRRAENKKLFSQEEGKAEQQFYFDVICFENDSAIMDEAAFIMAAARLVRQLGNSRRRGLGECTIHLCDFTSDNKNIDALKENDLLEHFNQAWLLGNKNLEKPTRNGIKANTVESICPPIDAKLQVRIILRLDEPLLISRRASAGNWFDTCPFIPGTTFRGALAALAAARCDLTNEKTYRDFVALFLRGGVIFPTLFPAYLLQSHIYPTVPPSLGLVTCNVAPFNDENQGHGVYKAWELKKCNGCGNEKLETVDNFFILKNDDSHAYSSGQSSEMHVHIDTESQRAVKGDLYGYNVLNAGQYFLGELYTDEKNWKLLREMAGIADVHPLRLGKARQRGYGKVTAWFEPQNNGSQNSMAHVFIQAPLDLRVPNLNEPITLTLLTDTIVTNSWGQQAQGFTEDWLEPTLNLGRLEIEYEHSHTHTIDGFNAILGLPRWRDTALTAGSMVRIILKNPPNNYQDFQKQLQNLEKEGIGLRRNEGFGRIAFNHPVYDLRKIDDKFAIKISEKLPLPSIEQPRKIIKFELWKKDLTKTLSEALGEKDGKGKGKFDSAIAALSRWLYSCSDNPIDELIEQFDPKQNKDNNKFFMGEPSAALKDAIGKDEEYGTRSKENFYMGDDKARAIIKFIFDTLKEIKIRMDKSFYKRGIEQIAECISELTTSREEDRQ